ncbi:MAG: NDP-sugar synthase [Thermoprotei archaeon]|nr:MAG: NDP-sugar synthase [Thermoprotei archaeon]
MRYRVIVLAGGYATRLRPLTITKPKPLLPVLGKPLISWIINNLVKNNVKEIIMALYHMADKIIEFLRNNYIIQFPIRYIIENRPLGDAGAIKYVSHVVDLKNPFIVVYGDVFSNVNLDDVIKFHLSHGNIATMVLTKVSDASRFGLVELKNDLVTKIIEKPSKRISGLVNAGIYVFEPEVLKLIPEGRSKLSIHVLPKLIEMKQLAGYIHKGLWSDIEELQDYFRINIELLRKVCKDTCIESNVDIGESVELIPPIYIGSSTALGSNTVIGPNVIIGSNTKLGRGVRIQNSILMNGVSIGDYSYISKSILSNNCYIGKWVRIDDWVIVGDGVTIHDEAYIAPHTAILPFKEISISIRREGEVIL